MNEYLQKLLGGYYNYTQPQTFLGERKAHWSGEMDMDQRGSYWNMPKLWGNQEPIGIISPDSIYTKPTRFYNDSDFENLFTKGKDSLLDYVRGFARSKMELPSYLAPKN